MNINKISRILYRLARIFNDANAAKRGTIGKTIGRRMTRRLTRKMIKKFFK